MEKPIDEYKKTVGKIEGIYLDSTFGFKLLREYISKVQREAVGSIKGLSSVEELDTRPFTYGEGPPGSRVLHGCTQGELKERNREGGKNYKNTGNYAVVLIYQFWEDKYREEIAESLGTTKNKLKSDVFGDLGYLRHSIVHNHGFANENLAKRAKFFKWFKRGEEIVIDKPKLLEIVNKVTEYLDSLQPVQGHQAGSNDSIILVVLTLLVITVTLITLNLSEIWRSAIDWITDLKWFWIGLLSMSVKQSTTSTTPGAGCPLSLHKLFSQATSLTNPLVDSLGKTMVLVSQWG